jgi:hypothetical protein
VQQVVPANDRARGRADDPAALVDQVDELVGWRAAA